MNNKVRQILAIIALVFMAVFTVSFVAWLINNNSWGGTVGYVALASIAVALSLLAVIKLCDMKRGNNEKLQQYYLPSETDETDETSETEQAIETEQDSQADKNSNVEKNADFSASCKKEQ